jgi:hypothetical protein
LGVKNNEIKIKKTQRIYSKSALFSLKFWAKIMWVLAILLTKN